MVVCERCHRKFETYAALKQHYGNQHPNVKWSGPLEEKLTEEKNMESYKANLRPTRSSRTKLAIAAVLILIVAGAGWIYLPSVFQGGSGNSGCGNFPFPPINGQALAVHYHVLLSIYVNGQEIKLPVGIGEGDSGPCTEPLHIHASDPTTSIIHVESPDTRTYNVGDFFKVWAATPNVGGPTPVVFDQNQIFSYHVGNGYELRMYVNGQQSTAYNSLVFQSHMNIIIAYGTSSGTDWSNYQTLSGQTWPYPNL